jgi:hypothetical protein
VQMGPDRNLVLESREKVGAKFGRQGGCNSSVVVYLQIGRRNVVVLRP